MNWKIVRKTIVFREIDPAYNKIVREEIVKKK